MADVVFDDPEALADLERIVHPAVRILVERALVNASEDEAPFVVIEAIKLVEGGLTQRCDEVWLIECSPDTQRSRMLARGSSAEDADRRIGAQGPDLGDRLAAILQGHRDGPRVRRLATDGSLDETRELMEDALADAFQAGVRRP
jgi:dephospho-CoA kinase